MKRKMVLARICLPLLIILAGSYQGLSQSCLPDGLIWPTQDDIDNFQFDYPNCSEIEGSVIIWGEGISDLSGLNVLNRINGDLEIRYAHDLVNLNGFENLEIVGGEIRLLDNHNLENITGFTSLDTINNSLKIHGNYSLHQITGFQNLKGVGHDLDLFGNDELIDIEFLGNLDHIGHSLRIAYCNSIVSLSGLSSVSTISENIEISANWILTDISAFQKLHSINGSFKIWGSDNLETISGFDSISSIGGEVYISGESISNLSALSNLQSIGGDLKIKCGLITSLDPLLNLTQIDGGLFISNNTLLTSLYGLDNINPLTIDSIVIESNPNLSICEIQSICNYLSGFPGSSYIANNAEGCNTVEEVEVACEGIGLEEYINDESDIIIHPNPAKENLNIEYLISDTPYSIYICNSRGQVMDEINIQNKPVQINVDVSQYPAGIYFVMIRKSDGSFVSSKLIIQ